MAEKELQTPVQFVKGVGPKLANVFARLGVRTVEDLLYYVPREWEDRTSLPPIVRLRQADLAVVRGEISRVEHQQTRGRFSILKVYLTDKTATIQAVFFNQPFLQRIFRRGMTLIVSGRVEFSKYDGLLQLLTRDYEIDTGEVLKIVPKYSLTEGLYPKKLRSVIKTVMEKYLSEVRDERARVAIKTLHQPEKITEIEPARAYLAYSELFIFQLGLLLHRQQLKTELRGRVFKIEETAVAEFCQQLPFKLTGAQERVLADIYNDLKEGRPMNRLLQGDVGSGKTVIAALAAFIAVRNGCQAAILAPTEILANQHYAKLTELFAPFKLKIELLTGATVTDELRAAIPEQDIIIGTHALIETKIKFRDLGLVVIDEQHRFGVHQRSALTRKGVAPHLLVMTATPIPRSLALTLYGDLDRSVIDELPPGRVPIRSYYVPEGKRAGANDFIREKLRAGRQAYVVCPLVEESDELDLKAASDEADRLQKDIFPEFRVGLLHGRMKSEDKAKVMKKFLEGKIQLLVSTTVIEVGIDVANATLMVIEHAERFGLSQLHQLRGRIGRGSEESYCFLVGNPKTVEARARLKAMIETTDGFAIAEADLRLRGPGEMFGARQSGLPNFRVADIIRDEQLLTQARAAALELIEEDPKSARDRWESQRYLFENAQKRLGDPALN
ncbi:MAG: ATP-dependent DNA helicase RecG [Candidatus Margulisiibacteriota bacterium]